MPDVLEAPLLPALYRAVFLYAGLPVPPDSARSECFVLRSGDQPPGLFAALLEEALVEDEAEVEVRADPPALRHPGQVVVVPGFEAPCPMADELRRAVCPGGGPVLLFAVERRGAGGRLLAVTWAAVPEEEPGPEEVFQAAVARWDPTR